MNQAFKDLIANHGYPIVPLVGTYVNFYEMAMENFDWMKGGYGEGLVLASPADGPNIRVSKWKNGTETSGDNLAKIHNIEEIMENDKENKIFGENTEKAKEIFAKMLEVEKSRLINGEAPKPKEAPAKKQPKAKQGKVELTPEEEKQYEEAIKSAKTKFDHQDAFFEKAMKGAQEYAGLIAKECLNDIKVEEGAPMDRHNAYILQVVKEDFIEYNKNKKAKK